MAKLIEMIHRVDEKTKKSFQKYCKERGLVQRWVIEQAILEYMKNNGQKIK